MSSHQVSLRMELAPDLPLVFADQIQLQQDIINLVMNGIEAMQPVMDRPRELVIRSSRGEADQMLVAVKDCGVGISAENVDRLFTAFFTTKSSGMGMDYRSAVRSSRPMGDGYRPPTIPGRARRFSSLCHCLKRTVRNRTLKMAARPRERPLAALGLGFASPVFGNDLQRWYSNELYSSLK